jgi:ribosome-associated protein
MPIPDAFMQTLEFELRGDFITLDRLLKATGLAESGGSAKAMVAAGGVQVDGRDELRKSCKLHAGQLVSARGTHVRIVATSATRPA